MLSDARLAELMQIQEDKRVCWERANDGVMSRLCCDIYGALSELAEARKLLREAMPHLHHTGATHHQQCACSVKRRIEAFIREELERKDGQ